MEDHFAAVLGRAGGEGSAASFLASASFAGPKPGYAFGTGAKGTGYYQDSADAESSSSSSSGGGKRSRSDGASGDGGLAARGKRAALAEAEAEALDGAALLAAAERRAALGAGGGEEAPAIEFDLDAAGLKQLALGFEKQITANQRQRVKFADQPEKFLDSVTTTAR
jgi:hypothetical protein